MEANVRNKILYLIQAWAHAFRNEPKYKVVQDTYQIMKVEGHVFPEFKESDAMFAAERVSRSWGRSRGAALTEPGLGAGWERWWQASCCLSQNTRPPDFAECP